MFSILEIGFVLHNLFFLIEHVATEHTEVTGDFFDTDFTDTYGTS